MKKIIFKYGIGAVSLFLVSCGSSSLGDGVEDSNDLTGQDKSVQSKFDWRLDYVDQDTVGINTKILDVDAFYTPKESIDAWHKRGMTVIAYLSVGTVETTRPNASDFPESIIGNDYPDFPDEKFLDIGDLDKLKPIMIKRLDLIKSKGFDGIEPDNMDLYDWDLNNANKTGFNLTMDQTQEYIDFLIVEAKKRGLSIGQKNASELSSEYVDKFDWALVESSFKGDFYDDLKVYVDKNKPVFAVEYTDKMSEEEFLRDVCPIAKEYSYTAILKNRDLNKFIRTCP